MCDFSSARVGDRVWGPRQGWGYIYEINESVLPVKVMFDNGEADSYDLTGREYRTDKYPTLFWDEVKIIPPPRPKRKVKESIDFRITINADAGGNIFIHSPRMKVDYLEPLCRQLGGPIDIHHEFEVEE